MRCSSRKKIKECKMKEAKLKYLKNFQKWKKIYKIIVFSRKKRVFIVTENRFRTVYYDIKDAWVWRRWYFLKAVSLLRKSKEQAVWSFLSCRRKERERNVNFHAREIFLSYLRYALWNYACRIAIFSSYNN